MVVLCGGDWALSSASKGLFSSRPLVWHTLCTWKLMVRRFFLCSFLDFISFSCKFCHFLHLPQFSPNFPQFPTISCDFPHFPQSFAVFRQFPPIFHNLPQVSLHFFHKLLLFSCNFPQSFAVSPMSPNHCPFPTLPAVPVFHGLPPISPNSPQLCGFPAISRTIPNGLRRQSIIPSPTLPGKSTGDLQGRGLAAADPGARLSDAPTGRGTAGGHAPLLPEHRLPPLLLPPPGRCPRPRHHAEAEWRVCQSYHRCPGGR